MGNMRSCVTIGESERGSNTRKPPFTTVNNGSVRPIRPGQSVLRRPTGQIGRNRALAASKLLPGTGRSWLTIGQRGGEAE